MPRKKKIKIAHTDKFIDSRDYEIGVDMATEPDKTVEITIEKIDEPEVLALPAPKPQPKHPPLVIVYK